MGRNVTPDPISQQMVAICFTRGKKKSTSLLIPSIRFTKLIIYFLKTKHSIHPRTDLPLYYSHEDHVLGTLRSVGKDGREIFVIPILDALLTDAFKRAPYYGEYLEHVAKYQQYMDEERGKAAKQTKPLAPKATKVTKPAGDEAPKHSSSQPPKSIPTPTESFKKDQGKKCKLVKETSNAPSLAKRSKAGKVTKKRMPKSPLRLVDEFVDEGVPQKEPAVGRILTLGDFQTLLEKKNASYRELTEINTGDQDEGQARPNPGKQDEVQAGSNHGDAAESQPQSSHVAHAGPNLEHMNLEVQSMVTGSLPLNQDTSSVPPMTTPVIDLTFPHLVSTTVHAPLPTSTTTITATISLPPPPPQLQQSTTDPILLQRIGELEQHMTDLIQNNLALEERLNKHGTQLYNLENLNIPQKVSKAVDEIVTDAVDWAMQAPLQAHFSDVGNIKSVGHFQVVIEPNGTVMELYMMNRPHGRMILASVEKGPLVWPSITEDGVTRLKEYVELTPAEAIQADCDIKAINIILQGLPTEIYALVSQHRVAKDLWEKIKLLMQGTSLTKQERECKLYDEFDKFTYKKGETLHEYYLRFTLLLNDMNIYKMPLEQFQVNTKFLNTLPDEWSKFVTDVKLVKDLHTTNVDQLHAYLQQHERHANEVRLMHERNPDPLALVASHQLTQPAYQSHLHTHPQSLSQLHVSPYQSSQFVTPYQTQQFTTNQSTPLSITYPTNEYQSTIHHNVYSPQPSILQLEYAPTAYQQQQPEFSQPDSSLVVPVFQKGDDPIDAINHMMSFLTVVVNNPGRQTTYAAGTTRKYTPGASGSNTGKQRTVICYNCKGEGHIAKQCTKPKRKRDETWFNDKVLLVQAQASGQALTEEEISFLADP
ncbi:retrovirus-related pol polyprotein from transposon TNT 1-94 [Tanacetum coccineum]